MSLTPFLESKEIKIFFKFISFIKNVGAEYKEKTGLTAEFYIANIGDGAREI